jgi:hypothetical protein
LKKKSKRILELEKEHELFLKKKGYTGKYKDLSVNELPDLRCTIPSGSVPGNGVSRKTNQYTGTELLGLGTLHKSNCVPIRKENKTAAIEISQMRRN